MDPFSRKEATLPPILRAGDVVAVFSPSSAAPHLFRSRFERGLDKLRSLGFEIVLSDHALSNIDGKAGTPLQRARDLEQLFYDARIRGIIASIGGDDARLIVPLVDWERVSRNPKWFVGYSDTTAIQCALLMKASMISIYGPSVMTDFSEVPDMPRESERSFLSNVSGCDTLALRPLKQLYREGRDWADQDPSGEERLRFHASSPIVLNPGKVEGRVVGGCIESLVELSESEGNPWLHVGDGDILLLETSAKKFHRKIFEQQLRSLRASKCIDLTAVVGIIYGAKCWREDEYQAVGDLLNRESGPSRIPVVIGLPTGHVTPCCSIPLGRKAELDCEGEQPVLYFR